MEKLLEKFNIGRETLNHAELQTLDEWAARMKSAELKLEDVKGYISKMREGVIRELTGEEYPKSLVQKLFRGRRERYLKARLYNYTLLYDFLTAPERAKSYVEKHFNNLKQN